MRRITRKYPLTLVAVVAMGLSFTVFLLVVSDALPGEGVWRALVVPAWLSMTVSAIVLTALPAVIGVPYAVLMIASIAICLLPFVALDWIVERCRRDVDAPEQPR